MPETPRSAKRRRLNDSSPAPAPPSSTRRSARSQRTKDDVYDFNDDIENRVLAENGKKSSAKKTVGLRTYSRKEASPKNAQDVAAPTAPSKLRSGLRDSTQGSEKALGDGTTRSGRMRGVKTAACTSGALGTEEDDELNADPLGSELRGLAQHEEINGTRTPTERSGIVTTRSSAKARAKTSLPQAENVPEPSDAAMDVKFDDVQSTPTPAVVKQDGERIPQIALLKSIVLSKLCRRRPIPLRNLSTQYAQLHTLLHATITAGESNSLLLIGARGSGKTALIDAALTDLARDEHQHFHTIRLNGFLQTDDKLALREIWRQLGREMEIADEDEAMGGGKSYADTLTTLLALLSHPDEIAATSGAEDGGDGKMAKSVIFVLDEFDLFAMHPRQTLLYNLLDIAQSRKAPIAVIGTTTRIDVVEALEKRVKSRFSHRYLHIGLPRTLSEFIDIGKAAVKIENGELSVSERVALRSGPGRGSKTPASPMDRWNASIDVLLADHAFLTTYIHPCYYTTKSVPTLLASLLLPFGALTSLPSARALHPATSDAPATAALLLAPPDSSLHILPSLSELALALLVAAARLTIIHSSDMTNFSLAYSEYIALASRARSSSAASGALASGAGTRVFGREVARREWERLVRYGLLVPAGSGAFGAGRLVGGGKEAVEMVRVDVALEELPGSVEMSAVMEKWCRQI